MILFVASWFFFSNETSERRLHPVIDRSFVAGVTVVNTGEVWENRDGYLKI
jgi:hypothetical protein